jgi:hypothetical protein
MQVKMEWYFAAQTNFGIDKKWPLLPCQYYKT